MKYICKICGYIYDDEKQSIPFVELPESWKCPLCGATKSQFAPQEEKVKEEVSDSVSFDEDVFNLSVGQLSALFSNLARGAEKQYIPEAQEEFLALSEWFYNATKGNGNASIADIESALRQDRKSVV